MLFNYKNINWSLCLFLCSCVMARNRMGNIATGVRIVFAIADQTQSHLKSTILDVLLIFIH